MIRKLLLPALLVGLLGGCVSAGYGYRDGYYYGQPSVEYRYRDYGYGYPYQYGHYGYYPYGERYRYYGHYGYPYRYGYGYPRYGYPYPYYPYRHPKPPVSGTPSDPRPPRVDGDNPPPWRDFDRRRRMGDVTGRPLQDQGAIPTAPRTVMREAPRREARAEGSVMGQVMRRTQEARRRESSDTQEP